MAGNTKLKKVMSLGTAVVGAFALLAPKKAAVVGDKLALSPLYENVGKADLVPREWYVDATRSSGAGMLAAGLTGFLLATRKEQRDETATDDVADATDADDVAVHGDPDDGPVEIDLDDAEDPSDD